MLIYAHETAPPCPNGMLLCTEYKAITKYFNYNGIQLWREELVTKREYKI